MAISNYYSLFVFVIYNFISLTQAVYFLDDNILDGIILAIY